MHRPRHPSSWATQLPSPNERTTRNLRLPLPEQDLRRLVRGRLCLEVDWFREHTLVLHLDIVVQYEPGEHRLELCHSEETTWATFIHPVNYNISIPSKIIHSPCMFSQAERNVIYTSCRRHLFSRIPLFLTYSRESPWVEGIWVLVVVSFGVCGALRNGDERALGDESSVFERVILEREALHTHYTQLSNSIL